MTNILIYKFFLLELNTLLLFFFTSISLTLFPGPDILFVVSTSLQKGWKKGVKLSLGLTSGIIIHTLVVVLGLGTILKHEPNIIRIIEISGATYLIYLAIQTWRNSIKNQNNLPKPSKNQNLFLTGFIMNLSNPKVSLFFLSFFPGFLFHHELSYSLQFFILGSIFFVQALFIFASCSILAARLGEKFKLSHRFSKWDKIQSLILFIIALILLYP
jgi:threonine/homoserine/homoserine lactone efflux protein